MRLPGFRRSQRDLSQGVTTSAGTGSASINSASAKQGLTQILDAEILPLFPTSAQVMAEVLTTVADARYVLTVALRPDTSVGLHILVRPGEGLIGNALKTGQAFAGPISREQGELPHLLDTRSALVVPVLGAGRRVLGIINVESPRADVLRTDTLDQIQASGIIDHVASELERLAAWTTTSEMAIERLLSDTEDSIFTIIDPVNIRGAYYQMLQLATQVIDRQDTAGGILLLRDEAANLVTSQTETGAREWIVVTSTLGAVRPTRAEWRLRPESAIGRAMASRAPLSFAPPEMDDFLSGGRFASGAQIVVPLLDGGRSIGAIVLYSATLPEFSAGDAEHLQRLARILVLAIKRTNDVSEARRASRQLAYALDVQRIVTPLFNDASLTNAQIEQIRLQALNSILGQSLRHTQSSCGAILLASQAKNLERLAVTVSQGQRAAGAAEPFIAVSGVVGKAYALGEPRVVSEVSAAADDERAIFAETRSVLAVPLKRGDDILGVLEVESDQSHHFTQEHLQWAGFLASQVVSALTAVDLATEKYRDRRMAELAKTVDSGIATLRGLSLDDLRNARDALLRDVLDTVTNLTGAIVGRVLTAINVLDDPAAEAEDARKADEIDLEHGVLLHLAESPPMPPGAPHYFPITLGLSGIVFREQRHQVFNSAEQRPTAFYTDPGEPTNIQSGLYIPLFEGTTKIGVFQLESSTPGAFTRELVRLGWSAAEMTSKIIFAMRLRLRQLQSTTLRDFEIEILRNQNTDRESYMRRALEAAAKLAEIEDGWGQIIEIRHSRARTTATARIEHVYSVEIRDQVAHTISAPPSVATFRADNPLIADYPIFQWVTETGKPYVVLDSTRQGESIQQALPWPQARSLICVPLLRPQEDERPETSEVFGLLMLASPDACDFSDADKRVLTMFARTVNLGLLNLNLLNARKQLMLEIIHMLTGVLFPLLPRLDALPEEIGELPIAELPQVRRVNGQIARTNELVTLLRDLVDWFRILSDEDPLAREPAPPVAVTRIADEMREPIHVLASILTGGDVRWVAPSEPLLIAGGEARQSKVKAALFNYIENALKYGRRDREVVVTIIRDGERARFTVRSAGKQLDPSEHDLIFTLDYRGLNAQGIAGSGLGLYQVKRIATELGGDVKYEPVGDDENDFILWVPAALPQ